MDIKQKVAALTRRIGPDQITLALREPLSRRSMLFTYDNKMVGLCGSGMGAVAYLDIPDITAIRDWCNAVLKAEGAE